MKPEHRVSALGPLRMLGVRSLVRAKPRAGTRRRSTAACAGRCAPRPLRCSDLRPRRETRCAHCVRYAQTVSASLMARGALRARAASPALLGAADSRRQAPARVFAIHRHLFAKEAAAQASSPCAGMTRACGARRAAGSMPASRRKPLPKLDCGCPAPMQACLPARRDGRRSAVVVPAGAGPIRGRLTGGAATPVLKRHCSRTAVRAREAPSPEHAGTAIALPQRYIAQQRNAEQRTMKVRNGPQAEVHRATAFRASRVACSAMDH